MKLIVGLGNPGENYKMTRHNVGFMLVDEIAKKLNLKFNKNKWNGTFVINDDFILAKPETYMNLSGNFIQSLINYYKILPSDVLVIYDEKDYEIGKSAIKIGGSSGGHNGIKSIINTIGNDFKRLRIGIGYNKNYVLSDWVLSKFTLEEIEILKSVFPIIEEAALSFVYNDINYVMNKFNQKKK